MKKKHIIKSGKRLIKKKIQSIKESKQPKFLFEGRLEDLKNSWTEFVNGARREGKETTEAAKILAKIINKKDVTEEDKKFLKSQSKDLARIVALMGLGAVSMALPIALEKVLNKWNISITYNPMTRDQFEPVYSFLLEKNGRLNPFYVQLPQQTNSRNAAFNSAGGTAITAQGGSGLTTPSHPGFGAASRDTYYASAASAGFFGGYGAGGAPSSGAYDNSGGVLSPYANTGNGSYKNNDAASGFVRIIWFE